MKSRQMTARKKTIAMRASRKVIIDFPAALYAQTEAATAALSINRSTLIRSAVEDFLKRVRRDKLAEALAEGYIANAFPARRQRKIFPTATRNPSSRCQGSASE